MSSRSNISISRRFTIFVILLGASLLFHTSSVRHANSDPDTTLVPGVDYVIGEVIAAFTAEAMTPLEEMPLSEAHFGVDSLDTFLDNHEVYKLTPFLTGDPCSSPGGQRLQRTFLIQFSGETDAQVLAEDLADFPQFEYVEVNYIHENTLHSLKRYEPSNATEFDQQWHMDFPSKDRADIDAPEAWAITRGTGDVVIVINDSGAMVDTCGGDPECNATDWILHSDFNHYWIAAEDSFSDDKLNRFDINQTDANGDLVNDNVIGATFGFGYKNAIPGSYELAWWNAVPSDIYLVDELVGWDCQNSLDHGTRVAGIAAATVAGADIVGVAPNSQVYWVKTQYNITNVADQGRAALSIEHSALYGDVINMSWGFIPTAQKPVNIVMYDAVEYAALDKDCVLVASVGNQDREDAVAYPALDPLVLAVGALDTLSTNGVELADYSNYVSTAEIVDVVATVDNGIWTDRHTQCSPPDCPCPQDEYTGSSQLGTSFSAPQAAGIAALIRGRFPALKQDQVRDRIKKSAEYYWSPGDNELYGKGKVNAYRALTEWGHVTSDTTWGGVTGMPDTLYLAGDLTIDEGVTLTIAKGSIVRVAPEDILASGADDDRIEIVVEGRLDLGTSGSGGDVVFESFVGGSPSGSDWVGIRYATGSSGIIKNANIGNGTVDVDIDEFDLAVGNWDETKTLYLNSNSSIAADFTIAEEESLFVVGESDVVVTGGAGVDITVNGSLICKGSASKKPEFRSSSGVARSWNIMTLSSDSENNLFHNTIIEDAQLAIRSYVPLVIDSCRIKDGIDGVQAYDSLTIRNTTIRDLTGNGVVLKAGRLLADNVTVFNAVSGIVQSTATSTGSVVCTDSYLHDLSFYGIAVPSASGGVTVERTTIEDAASGVRLAVQSASAIVDSCTLRRNDIGIEVILVADVTISNCEIDSNSTAGVYALASDPTVETSKISNSPIGVSFYYYSDGVVTGETQIIDNTTGVKCDVNSSPAIESTLIANNSVGVAVLNASNPFLGNADSEAPDTTCADPVPATSNSIHDNSSHHVVNLTGTVTIRAEGNWWGSSGPHSTKFSGAVDRHPYNCDEDPVEPWMVIVIDPQPEPQPDPRLPKAYQLSMNHPNPFNPVTTLHYDMPTSAHVDISVFDVSGKRVRSLVSGRQVAGSHAVTWMGETDRGEITASGVYFVRMTSGSFVQTRKVVLLK